MSTVHLLVSLGLIAVIAILFYQIIKGLRQKNQNLEGFLQAAIDRKKELGQERDEYQKDIEMLKHTCDGWEKAHKDISSKHNKVKSELTKLKRDVARKQKINGRPFVVDVYEFKDKKGKKCWDFKATGANGEPLGDNYSTENNAKRGAKTAYGDQLIGGVRRWRFSDEKA